MAEDDPRLLLLSPADNVVVARESLAPGTVLVFGDEAVRLAVAIERGHKLACRPIAPGGKVVKYGAPIGSASQAIAAGDHVHLHNLRSDYTATHGIGAVGQEGGQ